MIEFIRSLHWSGLIKTNWDPGEHPRWPAGAADSQGGQFAPRGTDAGTLHSLRTTNSKEDETEFAGGLLTSVAEITNEARGRAPTRKREAECNALLESDMYICGSLRDRREREICRSSANERYAACLRGKPLPPLALPNPEYDSRPPPAPSPQHRQPLRPPWWLPFFFFRPPFIPVPA